VWLKERCDENVFGLEDQIMRKGSDGKYFSYPVFRTGGTRRVSATTALEKEMMKICFRTTT
jgi:hypothetical protein